MIFNLGSRSAGASPQFSFTVNGTTYNFDDSSQTSSENGKYYFYRDAIGWEFYMLTSGTFNMLTKTVCDLFICGHGQSGGRGEFNYTSQTINGTVWYTGTSCSGGDGGNGGKRLTKKQIALEGGYSVSVPTGNTSTIFGSYNDSSDGYAQSRGHTNGGYSFDDSSAKGPDGNSRRVGACGGYGESTPGNNRHAGYDYGGGDGGPASSGSAYSGQSGKFYGAGGGGGGAWVVTNSSSNNISNVGGGAGGGAGYGGFVGIRNARAV